MAPLRILCLHAKQNTPESFAARTAFVKDLLGDATEIQTRYPAAPFTYDEGGYARGDS